MDDSFFEVFEINRFRNKVFMRFFYKKTPNTHYFLKNQSFALLPSLDD